MPGGSKRPSPQSVLPSAKRRRTTPLPKGQIIKVKMHNFMTYTDAVIEPGPRLNLVLGPNGTGKSSLVNALCIGLGGKPNLLGRADHVQDFVRKGTSEGYTEIHLSSGQSRPTIIKRVLSSSSNSTEWFLNGQKATQAAVLEKVSDLKIQVDNLCQFLPQDKVVMFARLTPTELLKETEKSIGDGELYNIHRELIEKKAEEHDTSHSAQVLEAELTKHKAANEGLERDVARFQERAALMKKVEVLDKRLPWLKYNEQKTTFLATKDRLTQGKQRYADRQAELASQQAPLREKQAQRDTVDAKRKRVCSATRRIEDIMVTNYDKANALDEEMETMRDSIESLEEDARRHEARIIGTEQKVADLEQQIQDMPAPPQRDQARENELRREQVELQARERSSQTEAEAKDQDAEGCQRDLGRLKTRLRQLDSVKGQRLAALEQRNPGITVASEWVAANQSRFRGCVYGPVIAEVEVSNPQHAAMLEQHVQMAQWLVFVTEHKDDQDQLIRVSREENWRFKPSVSCYNADASQDIPHSRGEAHQYRQFGIEATLDEVFEAPLLVKHNLKDEAGIHETYIGGRDSSQHVDAFLNGSNGIRVVWTPDSQYRVTQSAYNAAARSQTVIPLRPARFLKAGASGSAERAQIVAEIEAKEEELRQLQQERDQARQACQQASERVAKVRQQAKALVDARNKHERKVRDLQTRLRAEQKNLERLRKMPSPLDKKPQMQAELDEAAENAVLAAVKAGEMLAAMWKHMKAETAHTLAFKQLDLMVKGLMKSTEEAEADNERFRRNVLEQLQKLHDDERELLKRRKEQAEEVTGQFNDELKAEFATVAEYGETAAEVSTAIADLSGEADGIVCANPRVMEEYKERQEKIRQLEEKLQDETDLLETRQAELQQLEGRWKPELEKIVARVTRTFSRSFAKIGCAGEVALHLADAPGGGIDYNRCAINIKVKFREAEELQVLNAQRQSGGERSVSTILYLVALQGVAACPFRVVDEINQGMDPHNERKVFKELVSAATGEGTPQCFLLTPKLLPDLPFTENVNVLQIMNGSHIPTLAKNFSMESILGTRQAIAAH